MTELTQQNNSVGKTPQLESLSYYENLARAILIKKGRFHYSDLDLSELVSEMMLGDLKGTKYGREWKIKSFFYQLYKRKGTQPQTLDSCRSIWYMNTTDILNIDLDDLIKVKNISESDKKVLFDYYYERKTLREIGEELNLTTNVVKYRLKRTIQELCS